MRLIKLLLFIFVWTAAPAVAGPFEDAEAAYKRGDYTTALRMLRGLADRGDAAAQVNLGNMYGYGRGVPQDYATAAFWYQKAANQGIAIAQNNLGAMYNHGQGVPQDYAAAVFWYQKAAKQGNATAQNNLARMYYNGHGVPQNYVQAHMWFNLAASRAVEPEERKIREESINNRDIIANKMTLPQLAEAQNLAHAWRPVRPVIHPPPLGRAAGLSIPMKKDRGTYVVPVLINNAITLDFIVDSGASDVTIPEDVVSTLIRTGTIRETDFIGERTYVIADGSKVKSKTFRIRSLKVGDRVLENVTGSIASTNGPLLLGQSFLGRFKSWSIDNSRHELVLSDDPPALASPSPGTIIPLPAPPAVAPESADQLYDEAIKKLQEGDYAAAGRGFMTFIQRYPHSKLAGNAQYWLGESHYARRDYNSALTAFAEGDKVYKTSPKGPDNLLKLGITLAVLGRKADACAVFARFSEDYPRASEPQTRRIEQERQKNGCK